MKKIKIDSKKKLFYWGPADGRPVFLDFWNLGTFIFSRTYKPRWPPNIIYYEKEKLVFVCDHKKLHDNGEKIFKKYILDKARFKKAYGRWQKDLRNFILFRNNIKKTNLSLLTDIEVRNLFLKFISIYNINFWRNGLLPEMAGWGGEQLLVKELRNKIRKEGDFVQALERLTAPENLSFYQKEELHLLTIALEKNKNKRDERLKEHQKKYFWMLNNYHHVQILPISFFGKNLSKITAEQAEQKIREIEKIKMESIKNKKEIIEKYKLPKIILTIGRRMAFCIWWQDLRKSFIFQANYIISLFLEEFSRRYEVKNDNLFFYAVGDLESLVNGRAVSANEIMRRKKGFLVYADPGEEKIHLLSGKAAQKTFQRYLRKSVDKKIQELKGLVVNRGNVTGKVKIVLSPREIGKMKKGDILVTTMTTPDYIVALRKASALITDEGGMTCHAAIVSRELKIPGIVATKFATKVLKDGDLIEVDANRGIVKWLK
jgi:phosphohistidine swiveling domain-containing protein